MASARVCLAVFDWHPLAELRPARRRSGPLTQALLQKLVVGDLDGTPSAGGGIRATGAQRARLAGLGGELDLRTEDDRLLLACRARDRTITHVEREVPLAEVSAVAREPGPADDGAPARKDLVDDRRVYSHGQCGANG